VPVPIPRRGQRGAHHGNADCQRLASPASSDYTQPGGGQPSTTRSTTTHCCQADWVSTARTTWRRTTSTTREHQPDFDGDYALGQRHRGPSKITSSTSTVQHGVDVQVNEFHFSYSRRTGALAWTRTCPPTPAWLRTVVPLRQPFFLGPNVDELIQRFSSKTTSHHHRPTRSRPAASGCTRKLQIFRASSKDATCSTA